ILVKTTLSQSANRTGWTIEAEVNTDKLPNRKTNITDSRWVTLACKRQTTRTGRDRMAISVRMLGMAFPMKEPFRLMQVPGMVGFHVFSMGVHWKTLTKMMAMTHDTTMEPRMYAAMRNSRVGKMREYMSRMEILMIPTVVQ
ncbi:hypothetical protein T310_7688, partial [Rasamsonia emersonii CBS 393.64]